MVMCIPLIVHGFCYSASTYSPSSNRYIEISFELIHNGKFASVSLHFWPLVFVANHNETMPPPNRHVRIGARGNCRPAICWSSFPAVIVLIVKCDLLSYRMQWQPRNAFPFINLPFVPSWIDPWLNFWMLASSSRNTVSHFGRIMWCFLQSVSRTFGGITVSLHLDIYCAISGSTTWVDFALTGGVSAS